MKIWQIGVFGVMLVMLAGCKSLGLGGERVDYGAGANQVPALELPPDLTAPARDERYSVPQGDGESVATYSDYSKDDAAMSRESDTRPVSPGENAAANMAAAAASSAAKINTSGPAGTATLEEVFDGSKIIVVNDTFDRSWRRVGLAIERAGLVVEDKDRAGGIYFLQPAKAEGGWLDKLMFWEDGADSNLRYRVKVRDGGQACEASVTDQDGASDDVATRMIEAIYRHIGQ
jgi:outer membrane protein assembly factor BamC